MTDIDKVIKEAKEAVLPFLSWEQLTGESSAAYSAFCAFRDYGPERSILKAVEAEEKDKAKQAGRYRVWRNWCTKYRWRERAADYERYVENLKQEELRKTIEAQGEKHREVTGKMPDVVMKKLETMNPEDLTQGNVTDWVQTAIKAEREMSGLVMPEGKAERQQGELSFVQDFREL